MKKLCLALTAIVLAAPPASGQRREMGNLIVEGKLLDWIAGRPELDA
jgi:hypothetical protein